MHGRNIRFRWDLNQETLGRKISTITTELKRILPNAVVRYCIEIGKQPCLKEWPPVTLFGKIDRKNRSEKKM